MKNPIVITIFIVVVVVGGYLAYDHFYSKPQTTLWDLVPTETVLVYESSDCRDCIQQIRNSPLAEIISAASREVNGNDTLSRLNELLLSFQDPTLVSLHLTKKDEFDFAYFVQMSPTFQQKLALLTQQLKAAKGFKETQREFQTVPILEVTTGGKTFSAVIIDNIWVGSFSPILVEDVIRTYKSERKESFRNAIKSVYQLPRIKSDGGNVYIHLENLSQWFSVFLGPSSDFLIDHFGHSSLLDAKVAGNRLELNGFSYHPLNKKSFFLSVFQEQDPVEFALKNIISNRTMLVSDFGISDGKKFFTRLQALSKNPHLDTLSAMSSSLGLNLEGLLNDFSGEIALCHLESRKESIARILLVNDSKNAGKWFGEFQKVSTALAADTVFVDRHSSYEIFEIPIYNFPEKLFYPLVTGFNSSYYARAGNTLCVADNIEELKKFLDDIDNENTWGKSVSQNKFLESTLLESSVSIFVNTSKIWHLLSLNLEPRWQKFLEKNTSTFSQLDMGSIQFSHLNDTYYTNISWGFQDPKKEVEKRSADKYMTNFQAGIAAFTSVKSHVDKSIEALVQDSTGMLSLISDKGKILWQFPLESLITGNIYQIDYFKNGKLQYLFATSGKLHVLDRLGNYVKPFPVAIKENSIDGLSVIDYDHSKNYRFLVSSTSGQLWMFDKNGNNLEGWQPRSVDEQLIRPAEHHRILGRDYLVAVRRDGVVFLMNRRGEMIKNFPLDLNARLEGDIYLEIGKKTSDTYFTVVSVDGVKYSFNLQGKLLNSETLIKNAPDAKFRLVAEKNMKSYIILRREERMFTVFDDKGTAIINSDFIGNNPVSVDYYSFGNGKHYIVITDVSQNLSFVYDRKGNLVTPIPVDSRKLEIYPTDDGNLKGYFTDERNVTIGELP